MKFNKYMKKRLLNKALIVCLLIYMCIPIHIYVYAQQNMVLPVATTIALQGMTPESPGYIVVYTEATDTYSLSSLRDDERVYGVTALAPALVFTTGSGTVPIVRSGSAHVQVDTASGPIARGDVLISGNSLGKAVKAQTTDKNPFAIALESYDGRTTTSTVLVLLDAEQAKKELEIIAEKEKLVAEQTGESLASTTDDTETPSWWAPFARGAVATIIALCGLIFILYTFRASITNAIVSIGRNPRARLSITVLAFGNIFFALVLCAVVLFVAIAVLILPL
jgi:hypothetical protein